MAEIENISCCVCGVKIYVESNFMTVLRNKHNIFYCINGHGQSFTSKSEAERQKDFNKIIKEESNKRIDELKEEIAYLSELKKHLNKCPICDKIYSSKGNLNVHLKTHNSVKR